jgi:hypothetical protein
MPTLYNNDPDAFYIIGGMNSTTLFGDIHKYIISKNQWENIKIKSNSGLFKGRYGHTCIYFNESIYVFGGWADKKRTNDFLRFNFSRSCWKTEEIKAEDYIPSERDFHASVLHSNHFYIIGGSEKKCKLNEIHRIKIKDEMPGRSVHKDLGRLLGVLFEEHSFSDFRMVFREGEEVKLAVYSYMALVERRLGGVLKKMKEKGRILPPSFYLKLSKYFTNSSSFILMLL